MLHDEKRNTRTLGFRLKKRDPLLAVKGQFEQDDIVGAARGILCVGVGDLEPYRDRFKAFIISAMAIRVIGRPLNKTELLYALGKSESALARLLQTRPLNVVLASVPNPSGYRSPDSRMKYYMPIRASECTGLDPNTRDTFRELEEKIFEILFEPSKMQPFFRELGKGLKDKETQDRVLDCLQWVYQVIKDSEDSLDKVIKDLFTNKDAQAQVSEDGRVDVGSLVVFLRLMIGRGRESPIGRYLLRECAISWGQLEPANIDPSDREKCDKVIDCVLSPIIRVERERGGNVG